MKPQDTPTTRQGTGTHRREQPNKTVGMEDIPQEHRGLEGVKEGRTEGAKPAGSSEPRTSGMDDRPSRGVNRGLHP